MDCVGRLETLACTKVMNHGISIKRMCALRAGALTLSVGGSSGEWYCQEFYEETADPFIWPLLLLICLVFPLVYFLRKVCAFVCGLFEEGVRLKSLPWSTLVYHISVSIVESLVPFWLS